MARGVKARFIEPMLLLRSGTLPDDPAHWEYQLKFDGYRAIAFKTGGKLHLRSRNNNDFGVRYSAIMRGLAKLPNETVIDGEVVAMDQGGRPSFNALQNRRSRCGVNCWSRRLSRSSLSPCGTPASSTRGCRI